MKGLWDQVKVTKKVMGDQNFKAFRADVISSHTKATAARPPAKQPTSMTVAGHTQLTVQANIQCTLVHCKNALKRDHVLYCNLACTVTWV